MSNEIFEQAEILAATIAKSDVLSNLRNTESAMLADMQAQQIIQAFQAEQQRIADLQIQGQELSDDDQKSIEAMEEQVESYPMISAYLQAQDQFTQMLDQVNLILANAMSDEEGCNCGTGGGGGCGSHGASSGCGCGGSC